MLMRSSCRSPLRSNSRLEQRDHALGHVLLVVDVERGGTPQGSHGGRHVGDVTGAAAGP
jgi:hypothetical protein